MTKTLSELIDRAYDIQIYFCLSAYELHQSEDGSFVDFHVINVIDLPKLQSLAGDLIIKFYLADGYIIVRLFERNCF